MRTNKADPEVVARVRAGIRRAFNALRARGYVAKANFMCCGGCASEALGNDGVKPGSNVVYYHSQGHEDLVRTGTVHLHWDGDDAPIREELARAGLRVEWNGKPDECLFVAGLVS
jgi:hypothetical protein